MTPDLALFHRLAHRPFRDRTGLYAVEGIRPFLHALEAGRTLHSILVCETLLQNPFASKRVRVCRRAGVPVARVSPEEFRRFSHAERASGIAAVVRQHWTPLADVDPRRGLCRLAIGNLRSPGNFGTVLRTAEAVGAAGVLLIGNESDPFDPAVVRASMGGVFPLEFTRTTPQAFAGWARFHHCRVVGTSPRAAASYTEVSVEAPLVVMLGEERSGLSEEEMGLCTEMASLPIVGRADSLNVGVAAGVMLYEVMRRRAAGSKSAQG